MKDLEFLPEHHIRARQNQRLRFIRLWLLAILALSMVCWGIYSYNHIAAVRAELRDVQAQAAAIETDKHRAQLAELSQREKAYEAHAELVQQLSGDWSRARLLRDLARCLADQIVLTRVEIERQTRDVPVPAAPPVQNASRGPSGGTTETVDRVRLEGFAADDLSLARFLQDMNDSQVFQRGELAFSKDATFHEREVRVFACTSYVPVLEKKAPPAAQNGSGETKP